MCGSLRGDSAGTARGLWSRFGQNRRVQLSARRGLFWGQLGELVGTL